MLNWPRRLSVDVADVNCRQAIEVRQDVGEHARVQPRFVKIRQIEPFHADLPRVRMRSIHRDLGSAQRAAEAQLQLVDVIFVVELVVARNVVAHEHQLVDFNWHANLLHELAAQRLRECLTMLLATTWQEEEWPVVVHIARNQHAAVADNDCLGRDANVGHARSSCQTRPCRGGAPECATWTRTLLSTAVYTGIPLSDRDCRATTPDA